MPIHADCGSLPSTRGELKSAAAAAVASAIRAGAIRYERGRDLHRLLRVDTAGLLEDTEDVAAAIVSKLERSLRAERNRAASGHWTYDLNRHIALHQAYRAESAHLAALRGAPKT